MSDTAKVNIWEELRKPFPPGTVGILPKPYKKESPKGTCSECGGYHGLPAMHLDYIGHAAVTDRLNTVVGAQNWSLDPIAFDADGNPVTNSKGEMWFRLTIMEASKLCVGDGSYDAKQLISDALRNGAMRFGIGLDLRSKEELESHIQAPELKNDKAPIKPAKQEAIKEEVADKRMPSPKELMDLKKTFEKKGITDNTRMTAFVNETIGKKAITSVTELQDVTMALELLESEPF